jgi:hypothetical protein
LFASSFQTAKFFTSNKSHNHFLPIWDDNPIINTSCQAPNMGNYSYLSKNDALRSATKIKLINSYKYKYT